MANYYPREDFLDEQSGQHSEHDGSEVDYTLLTEAEKELNSSITKERLCILHSLQIEGLKHRCEQLNSLLAIRDETIRKLTEQLEQSQTRLEINFVNKHLVLSGMDL
jgi:hypothetical protein